MAVHRRAVRTALPRNALRGGGLVPARYRRRLRQAGFAALILSAAGALWIGAPWLEAMRQGAPDPAGHPAPTVKPPPLVALEESGAGDQRLVLEAPYDSLDGLTIVQGRYRVRIARVEGPSRNAVCSGEDNGPWACGLQARAALHNLIADKSLLCRPQRGGGSDVIVADCAADDEDIATALVATGWARPLPGQEATLGAARDAARAGRLGLWNGNWTIRGGF